LFFGNLWEHPVCPHAHAWRFNGTATDAKTPLLKNVLPFLPPIAHSWVKEIQNEHTIFNPHSSFVGDVGSGDVLGGTIDRVCPIQELA
jgi:hypothetical protein